jgi:hypothetical protein
LLTSNPYILEILLGISYLLLTYLLSFKVYKSYVISGLTTFALSIDPLLRMLSGDASFELGQACFLLAYTISVLYKKNNFILQGLFLGLFASSKFWGAVPFYVVALNGYNLLKKRFILKNFILQLLTGFVVFSLTYLKTFINYHGMFNIFFFQIKLLKYWALHSITNIPFASVLLFLTGQYKSWWGTNAIVSDSTWSFIWPILFIFAGIKIYSLVKKKSIHIDVLIAIIPIAYLFYLGAQAPFVRYFILILPFLYMVFIQQAVTYVHRFLKHRKHV